MPKDQATFILSIFNKILSSEPFKGKKGKKLFEL